METFSALLAICAGNSPVTGEFPKQSQWHRALMFSLICAWMNSSVNNRQLGGLRCQRAHYDVTVMSLYNFSGGNTLHHWRLSKFDDHVVDPGIAVGSEMHQSTRFTNISFAVIAWSIKFTRIVLKTFFFCCLHEGNINGDEDLIYIALFGVYNFSSTFEVEYFYDTIENDLNKIFSDVL